MKSQRRHDLATNELAEWLLNFPQWLRQNRKTVIIAALVVLGLIAYTIFYYNRQAKVADQQQALITNLLEQLKAQKEYALQGITTGLGVSESFFNTADALDLAAKKTENTSLAALAMIKRAEALRSELHYRAVPAETDIQKAQLNQAKDIYEQAFEKAANAHGIAAMAKYGTGLCLEDLGDLDSAERIYKQLSTDEIYQGTLYAIRAENRLKILPDVKREVYFRKVERPKPAPMPEIYQEPIIESPAVTAEPNLAK